MVYINRILLITTLVLFVTIWYGFIAEIILALFHIICVGVLLASWNQLKPEFRAILLNYIKMVLGYGIYSVFFWSKLSDNMFLFVISVVLIPISLAVYFTILLENFKLSHNDNTNT